MEATTRAHRSIAPARTASESQRRNVVTLVLGLRVGTNTFQPLADVQ
jgi:hypothetical protein